MKRTLRPATVATVVAVLAVAATACTAGSAGDQKIGKGGVTEPATIELWHPFTDREGKAIQAVVDDFHKKNPKITVVVKSNQNDDTTKKAIAAGAPIDVALSYSTDIVGVYCAKKAWRDLKPYIERDGVDINALPATVRTYTEHKGVRCAMPMLADAYGLYYNEDMLKAAGFTAPPKTMSELASMSEKLTKTDAAGNITQAGFMPVLGWYENSLAHWAPAFGATWFSDGQPQIGTDPAWAALLQTQKKLIDKYGIAKWNKFRDTLGDEFTAENAFEKGKVALHLDGEFRTAFIQNEAPKLKYGTAPFPVADDKPDLYGGGFITGNVLGIGRNSKHPEAAWELIKYLSLDTGAIVKLADGLHNLPTTKPALEKTPLKDDPHFKPFIDIFNSDKSVSIPTATNGGAPQDTFQAYADKYQNGKGGDLKAGLAGVDVQIKKELALVGG